MIHFNELRITNDSKYLIVDVSIDSDTYFTDVYLDNIKIDYQDTYIDTGPSTSPIYTYTVNTGVNVKNIRLVLDVSKLTVNLVNNMFFIWVTAKGTPSSSTPCGYDQSPIVGTAVNYYSIYQTAINYTKAVSAYGNIDPNFINFIMRLNMLKYAIQTGHNVEAITYWNAFFKNTGVVNTNCVCNG